MLYTDEQIQTNPNIVSTMTESDVDKFIAYYRGKHKISTRSLVQQRKKEFDDHKKLMNCVEIKKPILLKKMRRIFFLLSYPDAANDINGLGRTISNEIHDLPKIWTGRQSQSSINIGQVVYEHYYPRQHAGEFIVEECLRLGDQFTIRDLIECLWLFCCVHKTTKNENERLKEFQTKENLFTWEKSYSQAGIELVSIQDKAHLYDLVFAGVLDEKKW